MTSSETRKKFLKFFEKKGHTIVSSSSLIPDDPSVLFTTAGMQQFKPYYLGEKSPYGLNAASCQKCFRTSDIEEVGDESHLTFLEMLGNFSFAVSAEASGEGGEGYFKDEAIKLAYDFLFGELKLPLKDTFFTVFEGDGDVPEDKESVSVWKKMGIAENKIKKCGRKDNFWGPTGEEGPCGPTTEVHFDVGGKDIEVWNLVFNEYYQGRDKKLTHLKQKGVDTGMGLERLAMMVQKKSSVYETDLFWSIIQEIEKSAAKPYTLNPIPFRIIADHIKAATFLISEGILPSNLDRGYVLRRLIRRAITYGKLLNLADNFFIGLAKKAIEIYKDVYSELKSKETDILTVIQNEEEKFEKSLAPGLKELEIILRWWKEITGSDKPIDIMGAARELGKKLFFIYQSYGFPLELSVEELRRMAMKAGGAEDLARESFEEELRKHQEISRAGTEKKFGGHGIEAAATDEEKLKMMKLHTATHLLHAALREALGKHVRQMGSDINPERLRFDFSHIEKMTSEQIKKVEDLVNQKIKENLSVKKEEMSYGEAIKSGALAFFKEKYPEIVNVYSISNYSKEICAGPHVDNSGALGIFKITKEESSGAGIRRIRAILQ